MSSTPSLSRARTNSSCPGERRVPRPRHRCCRRPSATPPQAAPSTRRTYRSTLRSFAIFCELELGLPAAVGTVTLDTVLDYTAWLQDLDEESDEPRCHPRTVAKQLSAVRGFARWLAMVPELRIDARIQLIRVKAGPPPAPRALTPEQLRTLLAMPDRATIRGAARPRDPRARRAAPLGAV